jgi:predicted transcriptional regulator
MNKTVDLVSRWAEYETIYPNATIDDFCHFYIISKREKEKNDKILDGNIPPDSYSIAAKMFGRISKLHSSYAIKGLKDCGLKSLEEFLYLNSIGNLGNPKKTEVIYNNFNELSSGLLIIERLKNRGLINEEENNEDKRSKRMKLTKKGTAILKDCYKNMAVINEQFFGDIPKADVELCVKLLSSLEVKFASTWLTDKEKSFSELIK